MFTLYGSRPLLVDIFLLRPHRSGTEIRFFRRLYVLLLNIHTQNPQGTMNLLTKTLIQNFQRHSCRSSRFCLPSLFGSLLSCSYSLEVKSGLESCSLLCKLPQWASSIRQSRATFQEIQLLLACPLFLALAHLASLVCYLGLFLLDSSSQRPTSTRHITLVIHHPTLPSFPSTVRQCKRSVVIMGLPRKLKLPTVPSNTFHPPKMLALSLHDQELLPLPRPHHGILLCSEGSCSRTSFHLRQLHISLTRELRRTLLSNPLVSRLYQQSTCRRNWNRIRVAKKRFPCPSLALDWVFCGHEQHERRILYSATEHGINEFDI